MQLRLEQQGPACGSTSAPLEWADQLPKEPRCCMRVGQCRSGRGDELPVNDLPQEPVGEGDQVLVRRRSFRVGVHLPLCSPYPWQNPTERPEPPVLQRTYTRVAVVQIACVPAIAVPGRSP